MMPNSLWNPGSSSAELPADVLDSGNYFVR
jgi:hypothetical protein